MGGDFGYTLYSLYLAGIGFSSGETFCERLFDGHVSPYFENRMFLHVIQKIVLLAQVILDIVMHYFNSLN